MKKKTVSVTFMLLCIVFCTCLITSNFLETKVIQLGFVTFTSGMLVFPISYIINDCIAEVWGFRRTRFVIWLGFMLNFFAVGVGQIAVIIPAAPFWEGEEAFNFVFGLAPRVTIASFLAFIFGSFVNAYVMSKMKLQSKGKHFSLRAIVSTLAGEGIDSLIFFPIAFAGLMPPTELVKMMCIQMILKTLYEVLVLPITIRVVKYVKKFEGIDTYDKQISSNIFKIDDF
jgi:uncharacterized integral membrane protein (TIGR00697 family)